MVDYLGLGEELKQALADYTNSRCTADITLDLEEAVPVMLETSERVCAILRAAGITGWRRQQPIPGRPDFIFRRQRLAVFVDGCFWHGRIPQDNRNMQRDKVLSMRLRTAGWRVLCSRAHDLSIHETDVKLLA